MSFTDELNKNNIQEGSQINNPVDIVDTVNKQNNLLNPNINDNNSIDNFNNNLQDWSKTHLNNPIDNVGSTLPITNQGQANVDLISKQREQYISSEKRKTIYQSEGVATETVKAFGQGVGGLGIALGGLINFVNQGGTSSDNNIPIGGQGSTSPINLSFKDKIKKDKIEKDKIKKDNKHVFTFADSLTFGGGAMVAKNQFVYTPNIDNILDLPAGRLFAIVLGNVASQLPLMVIPGGITAKIGSKVVELGVNKLGQNIIAGTVGGLSANMTSTLQETGGAYQEAIDKGLTPEKASEIAKGIFIDNTKLLGKDAVEMILLVGPFKPSRLVKFGGTALLQGGEETIQGFWHDNNFNLVQNGKELDFGKYIQTTKAKNDFVLGLLGGTLMAGAFEGVTFLSAKINTQKNLISDLAKKGDDEKMKQLMEYSVVTGDLDTKTANEMIIYYNSLKQFFLDKAEPVVDKIATFVGAKIPLMQNHSSDYKPDEIDFIKKEAKSLYKENDPTQLKGVITDIQDLPDSTPWKNEYISNFQNKIKYLENQIIIGKEESLNDKYTEYLNKAMGGLYLNQHRKNISNKQEAKYTDIEQNFKTVAGKIQEYISQNNLEDITVQEVYDTYIEEKATRSKRLPKPVFNDTTTMQVDNKTVSKDLSNINNVKNNTFINTLDDKQLKEKYGISKSDKDEAIKTFPACSNGNCGIRSIQNWVNDGKKGKINSGVILPKVDGVSKSEQIKQYLNGVIYKNSLKTGNPTHNWYTDNKGEVFNDIYNNKIDGYYVTLDELNNFKEGVEVISENPTKNELYSKKDIKQIDNKLGTLNSTQELKARMGIKDTIKSYNKFIDIRFLINQGILKDKGIDKTNTKLKKFEFTNSAKEFFNVGKNEDLNFLKIGVHYPDALYKQVSNKVKALKKNGKSLESQRTKPNKDISVKISNIVKKNKTKKDIVKKENPLKGLTISQQHRAKRVANIIVKLYSNKTDPTQTQIAKLLNKYELKIIEAGTEQALSKNMIDENFYNEIIKAFTSKISKTTLAPTGRLNANQKVNILDMLGFQSLFKKIGDFKINIPQLSNSLKAIAGRLHLVETPSGQRARLPFTLMGNKSATYKQILLPMIKIGISKGAKRFVEPFGGAGTSYYFASEMFKSGLEEMHINHFDDEKYVIIKKIKDNKDVSIQKDVTEAFNTIIDDMGGVLAKIPEIKYIMDEYDVQIGTKGFKDMAELFFYPQYAKQFFTERPDTKLGIKGEISTTFKEWLQEKVQKDTGYEGEKLDVAVNEILTDSSMFETQYPQISKEIQTILSKYDSVEIKPGEYKEALLKSIAKHLRQRGESSQKVVSATNGFQSVLGAKEKMIDGLKVFQKTFINHGDKIHIYNMDGKEFITKMGGSFNNPQTLFYGDPPYVRTTGTYIKQNPSLKSSLNEYADTSKIHQIFEPMKNSLMMFTNDVDGKYFEALNTMLDGRMSKDIIAYREGTTPTSLITTNEIAVKPKDVGLRPYKIFKDKFLTDINKSLSESLFPKISKQLEKTIGKIEQHFMNKIKDKFGELLNIQNEVFTGAELRKDFEELMGDIVTGRDKQALLQKYKKLLSQNKVRGADVVKLIDEINKQWISKSKQIVDLKKQIEDFRKKTTIDAESKNNFFEWFNKEYTSKKVTENKIKEVEAIDKIMSLDTFTAEQADIFEKYLTDEKFHNEIENARKKSIYSLDIDQLKEMKDTVSYYEKVGKDFRNLKNLEFDNTVEAERIKTEPVIIKLEEGKRLKLSDSLKKENRLRELIIGAKIKTKRALLEATPSTWIMTEELNIDRAVYNLTDEGINIHRDYIEKVAHEFDIKTKELKIEKEGWKKITLHGLARRSDGKGIVKIIAKLKEDGMDSSLFSSEIQKFAGDTFLSENEKEMYDYMQGVFKDLGKSMRDTKIELDNEIVLLMDEYFPIQLDYDQNKDKFDVVDPLSFDNGSDLFRKVATKNGFTKEATGLEVIPDLRADKIFQNHVNNVSYYINMQKPIKQLNKLVLDLGVNKLGKLGFEYMKNYINILARQGIMGNQNFAQRLMSTIVKNFQTAVLGYNPVTSVLQTSAFLEAKAIGSKGNIKTYGEVLKIVLGKKDIWDMIAEKSGIIRNREYRNMFGNETDKFDKGLFEKFNKYGFWGIQKTDAITSRLVWYSEYIYQKEHGMNEADAIYEADTIVKKSMGHTHFEGKTQFVLENERTGMAFATVFQNFVLNHSAIVRYLGGKRIKEKYGTTRLGKMKALMYVGLFAVLLFGIYEELIRKGGRLLHNQKNYSGGMATKSIGQIMSTIPYVGILYSGARFSTTNIYAGSTDFLKGIEQLKFESILKGLGTMFGLAGTAEFDRIYKGYIKSSKAKGQNTRIRIRKTKTKTRKKRSN